MDKVKDTAGDIARETAGAARDVARDILPSQLRPGDEGGPPSLRCVICASLVGFGFGYGTKKISGFAGTVLGLSMIAYKAIVGLGFLTSYTRVVIEPVHKILSWVPARIEDGLDKVSQMREDRETFAVCFAGGFLLGLFGPVLA